MEHCVGAAVGVHDGADHQTGLRAPASRRGLLAHRVQGGRQRDACVISTSSGAGLQGSIRQTTCSAAIAGMTLVAAAEMGRYDA